MLKLFHLTYVSPNGPFAMSRVTALVTPKRDVRQKHSTAWKVPYVVLEAYAYVACPREIRQGEVSSGTFDTHVQLAHIIT